MKVKSKGVRVRVEFSVLFASFTFEGYIAEFDRFTLLVDALPLAGEEPASLTLAGFPMSTFEGDFREDETGMFLSLLISRPATERPFDVYRFHIVADNRPEDAKSLHIN